MSRMVRRTKLRRVPVAALLGLALMVGGSFIAVAPVYAAPEHGLAVVKGCDGPTTVGQKTSCYFGVYNTQGDPDTLTITSLVDVIHAASGDVNTGNILSSLDLTLSGGASCGGAPFTCTLPVGAGIESNTAFEFYTVTAGDVANANPLVDDVYVTWTDTCSSGAVNCPVGPQVSTTGSQVTLLKAPSSTATTILDNSDGSAVPPPYIVPAGTVVRDKATVTGTVGGPTPTGTVTFDFFTNGTCDGTPDSTSAPVALVSGVADATGFTKNLSSVGNYGFLAHYSGDGYYSTSDGTCEPISAVDARITITADGTNEVGDPHTFTVTLETNDGSGWAAAPGESVTTSLTDSNGASAGVNAGASTCAPPGGTLDGNGECTIVFQSGSAGVTTGNASWTGTVGGVTFTRATDGNSGPGGSGPAEKTWVDGRIKVTPSDTNEVGNAHTFDITVEQNSGDGAGWVPAVGVTVASSLAPGISTATITGGTCESSVTNASGVCTLTVNSPSVGTGTVNASATWSVGGVSISRATNGTSGYGSNTEGTKTWVDARIKITPDATNEVGTDHTFTVTVEKNDGSVSSSTWTPAVGVTVTPSISNALGASATVTGGTCQSTVTNASGQCTIIINSPTTGQTTVNASTSVTVNGVVGSATVSRSTSGNSGPGGGSPRVKTWVDASIVITPSETSEVGGTLTFTVTVRKDLGDGNGLVAASGVTVTPAIANILGANATITGGTCTTTVTDASGQCTFTVSSPVTGRTVGNASATIVVDGVSIDRDTDPDTATPQGSCSPNCGPATKTWVDANISIGPDGVNQVGDAHTFTVTVNQDAGDGNGMQPVSGASVFTLLDIGGSSASVTGGTCGSGTTNASGQCTIIVNSQTAGTATVDVSVTLTINGLVGSATVTRNTAGDSGPGGSDGATKTWVNARITIEADATNEVGDDHTFTVTVEADTGQGMDAAPGITVTPSITNSNGATATITGGTCTTTVTDASGQCTIVISSPTAGQTAANASATVEVGGVPITIDTDPDTQAPSGPGGSTGPAIKTWVDASIVITPSNTSEVGGTLTFVVKVKKNLGDGNGFVPAAGVTVSPAIANLFGAGATITGGTCTTTVTDAEGECTITVSSPTPGRTPGNAAATIVIDGVSIDRDTDPNTPTPQGPCGSDCGPAIKTWVDATIVINPDGVNEAGDEHTFTVTVTKNAGDGAGFVPAAGETVTSSLANSNGAEATIIGGTCESGVTDAAGQCTVVVNSTPTGVAKVDVSVTLTIDGYEGSAEVTRATDGNPGPGGSDGATKTWVDANITIGPDGRNPVNAPHTFVVTVQQDRGDGNGFIPAEGAAVTFTLDDTDGATTTVDEAESTCVTEGVTNADGQCTIVFTSSTAGTTTGNAFTTLSVEGVTLNRDTDPSTDDPTAGPGGSGPAVKTWYAPPTTIAPVLPRTGANTSSLVLPGMAMIAAGAALLLASARSMARRRRMI